MKTFTNLIKCASLGTINKKRYYLFIITMLLTLGAGTAWGEEVTETITMKNFGGLTTSSLIYQTKPGLSDKGTEMVAFAFTPTTGQVRGNQTGIVGASVTTDQKSHNWSLYNSDPMAGVIKAIKVTQTATGSNKFQNNLYVSLGTSSQGEVTVVTNAQKQDAGGTTQEINFTIDPSKGYTYFKLLSNEKFTSGTVAGVIVTVTYETAGGGETPDPEPDPNQYTIKWHTAKGVTTDVTLKEGATINKPATDPTMNGYEFMGWTASCDVASDGSDFTALTDFGTADSDKDFYAVFAVTTTTGGGGTTTETLKGSDVTYSSTSSGYKSFTATTASGTWTGTANYNTQGYIQINKNSKNYHIGSPVFASNVKSIKFTTTNSSAANRTFYICSSNSTAEPNSGDLGSHKTTTVNESFTIDLTTDAKQFYIYSSGAVYISQIDVTYSGGGTTTYDNYITTCASDIEYIELGDDFKWSATEAEVTIDATDNEFPTLTNTHNVPVKYSSSDNAIATIASDGTVTLNEEGTVTITAKYEGGTSAGTDKEYKAKTVTYSLKVNKAVAQPTGTMYVKVTDAVTDGEYLIVYEAGNVAFDGSLATLDAAGNMIEAQISSNTIAGNTEIDKATFTIASMTGGHSIQSKSGKYIGRTANSNGMNTGNSAIANVITFSNGAVKVAGSGNGSTTSLQYYAQSGSERFRYYATSQKPIALYKKVDPNAVVEPIFTPIAGEYYGTQSVTISCATAGAEVYYTLVGTDPTSTSTKYTGAISIASTTTVKAIAVKGENSSAVVSATYTILAPLATMQEIFDKATAVGETATPVHITMNNWVVTGVKNSNAYVTDGTKGLIIYKASHGFKVGDILSGTVACKVQLYKGSAELTELTATTEGLTVTTGGVVTPVVVNDVTTLGGVNTGSVIKITGPCTVNGTKYYVAGLELYNSLFAYTNPEAGFNYECTGVYVQFDATQEILPRKAEDLVKIETQQPAGIVFAVTEHTAEVGATDFEEPELTNPNGLTVTYSTSDATLATVDATTGEVTIGNKAGKVTITASFAGSEDYVAATASYNITISDPNQLEATFVAGTDKSDTKSISKNGITVEFADGSFSRDDNYRCYAGKSMTISYADGNITKIVIECTANDGAEYGPGQFTTETATYSYSGKVGTWTGEANSVTFTNIKQVRMTAITVYYKQDNRADAGLAWNPATISLTVGDAFTAPTFSNPNSLAVSFESSNTELATVDNAGVISLVSGKTGIATITATFADGHADYKPAEATCVITVSPKSEKVVILAQYNGQWYALQAAYFSTYNNRLAAIPVNYVGGKLYNVEEGDKATIEWQLAVSGTKATFKNGENYLTGANGTDLKLGTATFEWDYNGELFLTDGDSRTFIYHKDGYFRNYATSNAIPNSTTYSNKPIVIAPVYPTGDAYGRSVNLGTDGYRYGTICLPFGSTYFTGAEFFECVGKEEGKVYLGSVTTLVAGTPYIFLASATEVAVYGDGTTAATPGNSNGLHGTFTDETTVAEGNYILLNNELRKSDGTAKVNANRAYLNLAAIEGDAPVQMPGRRYIGMSVQGENEATGFDNIQLPNANSQKLIINGQLIIIRDGEMYNAQGQRL